MPINPVKKNEIFPNFLPSGAVYRVMRAAGSRFHVIFAGKTDEELVKRALGGSDTAWLALVKRYEDRLYNHAFRMVGNADDAMDLLQDVMLSVYRNLASFRGDAPFAAWLFRIATFRCTDHLRRKRLPSMEATDVADTQMNPAASLEATRSNEDILRMLAFLSNEQRQVVELKFFQNFTFEEIGGQLGISANTAKTRLYTALRKLRNNRETGDIACEG